MPAASGNLYSDSTVNGFVAGDTIVLLSQTGSGTWAVDSATGQIDYTPPSPDLCEAVTATFEITSSIDCQCCDTFTVDYDPVCCDPPIADVVCQNPTDATMVSFDVTGTPSAGNNLTTGTYTITLQSNGSLIEVGTVGNPAMDTVTADLSAVAGQQVIFTYIVRDDCQTPNLEDTDSCTVTVPCVAPTCTLNASFTDPANVMVSWTASPSGSYVLQNAIVRVLDGTTQVDIYAVPFADIASGSTTFDLSAHAGLTLTIQLIVTDTCSPFSFGTCEDTVMIPDDDCPTCGFCDSVDPPCPLTISRSSESLQPDYTDIPYDALNGATFPSFDMCLDGATEVTIELLTNLGSVYADTTITYTGATLLDKANNLASELETWLEDTFANGGAGVGGDWTVVTSVSGGGIRIDDITGEGYALDGALSLGTQITEIDIIEDTNSGQNLQTITYTPTEWEHPCLAEIQAFFSGGTEGDHEPDGACGFTITQALACGSTITGTLTIADPVVYQFTVTDAMGNEEFSATFEGGAGCSPYQCERVYDLSIQSQNQGMDLNGNPAIDFANGGASVSWGGSSGLPPTTPCPPPTPI